jgi:hypothetical protein
MCVSKVSIGHFDGAAENPPGGHLLRCRVRPNALVLVGNKPEKMIDPGRVSRPRSGNSGSKSQGGRLIREERRVIKRSIAAVAAALMIVPFFGGVASAQPDRVGCLFYQTFREREITDCL